MGGSFSDDLKRSYLARDSELRREFRRSLPLQDAMDDRWGRAKRLGFAEGASIYNSAVVFGDVFVGAGTWVGPYVILDGSGGGIEIGSTCSISSGVYVYTHDTIGWALSGGEYGPRQGAVKIGNCCYIASQSIISAGVTIGDRCVVSANSFVNRDVPANTIVGGTPAEKIGHVEMHEQEPILVFENGKRANVVSQGGKLL